MKKGGKWPVYLSLGLLLAAFVSLLIGRADRQLTYIESVLLNGQSGGGMVLSEPGAVLSQEFKMPFELFQGMEIQIGNYGRNSNSFWKVSLQDASNGKKLHTWQFNASETSDGDYYSLTVNTPIRVNKDGDYLISVTSPDCSGQSALFFHASEDPLAYDGGRLYLNGQEQYGDLCFEISGGERDPFWIGFCLTLILLTVAFFLLLVFRRARSKQVPGSGFSLRDPLIGAFLTGLVFFLLVFLFTRDNAGTFTDECDNIRGGLILARGGVLYRDYYTQHTPFGYYLCALYALFGAGSIMQFRLCYYLTLSAVWAGLYFRHCLCFGRLRMFLLPVLQAVVITPLFFQGSKIMGDNVQALCMAALALEFIRYWKDSELKAGRCLIAAACIYISVASAFVSVFALAPMIAGVILREIVCWVRNHPRTPSLPVFLFQRFRNLIIFTAAPFILTLLYFACNHALRQFYLMAYRFNTMVYNHYQNQFGRVKWKPFFLGVQNYFSSVTDNFNALITASGTTEKVIMLILAAAAAAILILWACGGIKGELRWLAVLCLFFTMSGNATRSAADFHGIGLYSVALTLLLTLTVDWQIRINRKPAAAAAVIAGCYLLQPYVAQTAELVVCHPQSVSGVDRQIVEMTEPGEPIFLDAFVNDSIYLLYKDRYPVNRNCYLLPWYMDWFEQDTIDDLTASLPAVAVYKPETEVYGLTGFCPGLDQAIRDNYHRLSEDSILWRLE